MFLRLGPGWGEQFPLGLRMLDRFLVEWEASVSCVGWEKVTRRRDTLGIILGKLRLLWGWWRP